MGCRSEVCWRSGHLDGDVPLYLTHPAFHLLAEIVVPAAVPPDLSTVLAAPQLVPLPVIWLSGSPVPRKAGQSSALDAPSSQQPSSPPQKRVALGGSGSSSCSLGVWESGVGGWLENLVPEGRVGVYWGKRPDGRPQAKLTGREEEKRLTYNCAYSLYHPPISRSHHCQ